MTSVDSGVETGNDSNDSSVNHENNIAAGSGFVSNNTVTNNVNQDVNCLQKSPLIPSITSICPATTNNSENCQSTSLPSTSGPLVIHTSANACKVLEFRMPPIHSIYVPGMSTMKFIESGFEQRDRKNDRRMRMSEYTVRRNSKYKAWQDFLGPVDERKLRLAAATNNIEMMRRLLTNGVNPNNHDDQGRSPLHLASSRGYTEIVRILLEHGADPNQRDCLGNTPLHLAAVTSKIAVITLLLKAGTDVLSSDQHGHNPLQLAQTKLRILQSCKGSDMSRIKEEVHNVIGMLLAYLQRQKDAREQVEALSTFCSRLSLSSTSDQIQDDVRDLLANIDSLSIAS